MKLLNLDHFAFGTADLETGQAQMAALLGVAPCVNGKHKLFGTHNALWRIETAMDPVYLELIAIDPDAPATERKRWFGLDDPEVQKRFETELKLLTFVANTDDIVMARRSMTADPGIPVEVTRGDLRWQFSLHADGRLVKNGALPYIIEWAPGPRPVESMPDQNIHLKSVTGSDIKKLAINWPCPHKKSDAALECTLINAKGETVSFSTV